MLPFPNGRARRVLVLITLIATQLSLLAWDASAQKAKKSGGQKKNAKAGATATGTPAPSSLVPLPIGHEAKGLVFPDIDEDGHLRGRFTAGTAMRVDQNHMEFHDLQITTFNDQGQPDLMVEMSSSVLDLDTRRLSSPTPTRIRRTDFDVMGDSADFDTVKRQGTLTGHVKMTITDPQKFSGAKPSPKPSATP